MMEFLSRRITRLALIAVLSVLGGVSAADAGMNRSLLRSPEALAMGGAYTAIVDDGDSPFYNPAGVAGIEQLEVHFVSINPTVSQWVTSGYNDLKDLKNPSGSSVNLLMGKNIYAQATATSSVLMPGFAIVGLYDLQAALYAKNQALPKVEYGYQTTRGVQLSFAFSTSDGKKKGRGKKNKEYLNEWRYGAGVKYLSRTGGYRLLSTAELLAIDTSNKSTYMGGTGSGYGFDFGVQRIQRMSPTLAFHWGAAFLNAGDVTFGNGASPVKGDVSTGLGMTLKSTWADLTLAYDIQQLNRDDDFTKKQNFGARVSLPLLDISAGFHQGFLTYGAAFDLWITRISAVIYKEELGMYQKQSTETRYDFRADFKMVF